MDGFLRRSIMVRIFWRVALVQMLLLIGAAVTVGLMSRWSEDPEKAGALIALRALEQDISVGPSGTIVIPIDGRISRIARSAPEFWAVARGETGEARIGAAPAEGTEPLIDPTLRTSSVVLERTSMRGPVAFSARDGLVLITGGYTPSNLDKAMFLLSLTPEIIGLGALQLFGVALALLMAPRDIRLAIKPVMAMMSGQPHALDGRDVTAAAPRELKPMLGLASGAIRTLQEEATRQRNYSGDIAHELLTPLGTMHHQLEALEDGPARRALEADVTRMTEAVRALLELAVRQDRDVSLPVADLARLVREAVAERAPLCFTYGIGIVYEGPATGVSARVSPVLIRCLLLNLIDNAIRHSGSTWITVSLVPLGTIDIVDGGWIVPAKREALLARRERGGALTPGTGLGLALVRDIAERHDADLAITDRNGRHTVFRIDFRRCIAT